MRAKGKRKLEKREKCAIDDCGQEARCRFLCGACYQWVRSIGLMDRYHLQDYLTRARFRTHRMEIRISRYGGGKVIRFRKIA